MNTYEPSPKKTWLISIIIFAIICLVFAFARNQFELKGLGYGILFGVTFVAIILFFGLSQRIDITTTEVIYTSNLFSMFTNKYIKKLNINQITEVNLGKPKRNKNKATYASINILTANDEISFNPDLFDKVTLQKLFRVLKEYNPKTRFDNKIKNFLSL